MDQTESKVIVNLLLTTVVFCTIMGVIGYVVTRYPELIDGASTIMPMRSASRRNSTSLSVFVVS